MHLLNQVKHTFLIFEVFLSWYIIYLVFKQPASSNVTDQQLIDTFPIGCNILFFLFSQPLVITQRLKLLILTTMLGLLVVRRLTRLRLPSALLY